MVTSTNEPESQVPVQVHPEDGSASEEKKMMSHEDFRQPDPDIETPRDDTEQNTPMTFKRFMALFSLGCLLAAAQIPLYLIGGSLCISPMNSVP